MHRFFRLLSLALPLWLIACSSTPVATSAPAANATGSPAQPSTAPAATAAAPSAAAGRDVGSTSLSPDAALLRDHSVYFEFDDAAVGSQYAPLIQRHGQYLLSHPSAKVLVQGNTDERGGSEYNLALGQRRADAVSAALRVYGVRDSQIEAVSYGEERPMAQGHDEAAWRQNRRADIVYPH